MNTPSSRSISMGWKLLAHMKFRPLSSVYFHTSSRRCIASGSYAASLLVAERNGDQPPREYCHQSVNNDDESDGNASALTRRASVVYGIPHSTLRNKIYKLEAAEDNGDRTFKRRRLTAFSVHKREQRLMAHWSLTESASGDSSFADGEDRGTAAQTRRAAESPLGDADAQPVGEPVAVMTQMPSVLLRQNSVPTFPFLGASVGSAEQLLKEFSSMASSANALPGGQLLGIRFCSSTANSEKCLSEKVEKELAKASSTAHELAAKLTSQSTSHVLAIMGVGFGIVLSTMGSILVLAYTFFWGFAEVLRALHAMQTSIDDIKNTICDNK